MGLLDLERGSGRLLSAEEFNAALADNFSAQSVEPFRPVTDAELARVRELRDTLGLRWYALEPGGTLSVPFPAVMELA